MPITSVVRPLQNSRPSWTRLKEPRQNMHSIPPLSSHIKQTFTQPILLLRLRPKHSVPLQKQWRVLRLTSSRRHSSN